MKWLGKQVLTKLLLSQQLVPNNYAVWPARLCGSEHSKIMHMADASKIELARLRTHTTLTLGSPGSVVDNAPVVDLAENQEHAATRVTMVQSPPK